MMRVLCIGESWQGSCARSLREAFTAHPDVTVGEVAEDHYLPKHSGILLRVANRLLHTLQLSELERAIRKALIDFRPEVVVAYKGTGIGSDLVRDIQRLGIPVINVFPDLSPHAHGRRLKEALGLYDLVISTKPIHPALWTSVYGYSNHCVCVPHGYDPQVHMWDAPCGTHEYDVTLCCTWRPEYHRLMCDFAEALQNPGITVAIAGAGWLSRRKELPRQWRFLEPLTGRAYGEFLRSGKVAIAPINREMMINGVRQPGDEDTTRTYELAAAYCAFLHQRSEFVATIYDEQTEVPLWRDAEELAALVRRWVPDEAGRRLIAARAHARAVPEYSIPERAKSVLQHVRALIQKNTASKAGK